MKQVLVLIITLCALEIIDKSAAHPLLGSAERYTHTIRKGALKSSEQIEEPINTEPAPAKVNHITNLVKPSEIRVPTLAEIRPYVEGNWGQEQEEQQESVGQQNSDEDAAMKLGAEDYTEQERMTLSYAQLYKLLALWQMEHEKNAYDLSNGAKTTTDN